MCFKLFLSIFSIIIKTIKKLRRRLLIILFPDSNIMHQHKHIDCMKKILIEICIAGITMLPFIVKNHERQH